MRKFVPIAVGGVATFGAYKAYQDYAQTSHAAETDTEQKAIVPSRMMVPAEKGVQLVLTGARSGRYKVPAQFETMLRHNGVTASLVRNDNVLVASGQQLIRIRVAIDQNDKTLQKLQEFSSVEQITLPKSGWLWPTADNVKQLLSVNQQIVAVTDSGRLLTIDESNHVQRAKAPDNVVQLAQTKDIVYALVKSGELYQAKTGMSNWSRVNLDAKWSKVSCGDGHCLALTRDSRLFGWGLTEYGQLSMAPSAGEVKQPLELKAFWSQLPTAFVNEDPELQCRDVHAQGSVSFITLYSPRTQSETVWSVGEGLMAGTANAPVKKWQSSAIAALSDKHQYTADGVKQPVRVREWIDGGLYVAAVLDTGVETGGNDVMAWGANQRQELNVTPRKLQTPANVPSFVADAVDRMQTYDKPKDGEARLVHLAAGDGVTAQIIIC